MLHPEVSDSVFERVDCIQLFRERRSETNCMPQSQKVIWDMIYTLFLATIAVEPTFVAFFLISIRENMSMASLANLSNFFEEQ